MNRCDPRAAPAHTPDPPAAPAARLRTVVAGCEALEPGRGEARHRHLEPYAIAVIAGQFDQVSYAGRVRVSAGELVVQPALDAHANRMPPARGARILRLPWPDVDGLGGVYPLRDLDAIVRAAERDPHAAAALARQQCAEVRAPRRPAGDLPDLLAAHLVAGAVTSLAAWAAAAGVARETASRAFVAAFGIPARQFRVELRVRAAWLQIVRTRTRLAEIAAATGFADQAHMTRQVCALTGASPSAWRRDVRTQAFYRCNSCRPSRSISSPA